jgi:hypothetical protein
MYLLEGGIIQGNAEGHLVPLPLGALVPRLNQLAFGSILLMGQ